MNGGDAYFLSVDVGFVSLGPVLSTSVHRNGVPYLRPLTLAFESRVWIVQGPSTCPLNVLPLLMLGNNSKNGHSLPFVPAGIARHRCNGKTLYSRTYAAHASLSDMRRVVVTSEGQLLWVGVRSHGS
jgi:hypothetical protein